MKGNDIFRASQAATAIRLSMDEGSSSSPSACSSSAVHLGGSRAIDRHNPIIRDSNRISKVLTPCTSQPPINPKPLNHPHDNLKNSSKKKKSSTSSKQGVLKKKNWAEVDTNKSNINAAVTRKGWSCTKSGDFISPPGSSRYLLSEKPFLNVLSDSNPVLKLLPVEHSKSQALKTTDDSSSAPKESKPPTSSGCPDQVVVLRVSLHCKGCERKMRKHISRMEGVTSFNIDFAAKKITVVGDVTPLGVLASVSKVKNAQLWTPSMSELVPPPSFNFTESEVKNKQINV